MKKLTGAQIVIETLIAEGVDVIFGYPGGAILPTYDALLDSKIKHILVRHEQGATHMAEGYARVSGRPGVVLVTSGPGATNAVTGIADAYMDSTPMVVLTGQVPTSMIGNDAFQEVDIVGITRPCTKHNFLVKEVGDISRVIREAFYIAGSGRPGPVLVDLAEGCAAGRARLQAVRQGRPARLQTDLQGQSAPDRARHRGDREKREAALLCRRRRAMVGRRGGASAARERPRHSGDRNADGARLDPGDGSLRLGMLGMHGSYGTNTAVCNTDCLIAVGARFDDRVTGRIKDFAPKAETIIHIDIDPSSISKNVKVDIPIVGDIKSVLTDMLEAVKGHESIGKRRAVWAKWHQQILKWQKDKPLYENNKRGENISPQHVIEEMANLTKGDAIIATDVGQHQMWVAQMFPFIKPRSWLTSGGLGTMGYGFPAGIGATFAAPDRKVVVVSGDGSIQMNIQELGTAVQYNVDIKVIILNNYFLGMVRQWQERFYQERYSYSAMSVPNFVKLAEAYGAHGFRIEKTKDLAKTMKDAFATPGPVLIDVVIPKEEAVMPMIPPAAACPRCCSRRSRSRGVYLHGADYRISVVKTFR